MNYYKKILVLKEVSEGYSVSGKPVSGIARIEAESGILTLHLSFINVAVTDGGSYHLFLKMGAEKLYSFDLGKRPVSFRTVITDDINFDSGFAVSLFFIRNDLPVMVAHSCTDDFSFSPSDIKKAVIDRCISKVKHGTTPPKPTPVKPPLSPLPTPDPNTLPPDEFKGYDDEVVATENYYDLDGDFAKKLKFIESFDNDNLFSENGLSSCDGKEETEKNGSVFNGAPHETNASACQDYSPDNPYYLTVKKELDGIFIKFPEEPCLIRNVPDSKWAKIYYSETKYYVVGLVVENNSEKYICYGVPAKYSPTPPDTLKGFCSFVPKSIFDLTGEGYWMMFQDAVTGECVKMDGAC